MHLVVGATGALGGMIARRLLERGDEVRVLVRDGANASAFVAAGAEAVPGDLKDRTSLDRACQGIDVVVTTANSAQRGGADNPQTVELEGNANLIDAARDAGVRQMVFVSALGATEDSPIDFLRGKGVTERRLRESGMRWTIIAPNVFVEVWGGIVIESAAAQNRPVAIVGAGERRHSFISMQDVAAFTAAAVANPRAENRYLPLGGPEALSWRELVQRFNRARRTSLDIHSMSVPEAMTVMPPHLAGLLASFDTFDSPIEMQPLYEEFGVQPRSVDQWAAGSS